MTKSFEGSPNVFGITLYPAYSNVNLYHILYHSLSENQKNISHLSNHGMKPIVLSMIHSIKNSIISSLAVFHLLFLSISKFQCNLKYLGMETIVGKKITEHGVRKCKFDSNSSPEWLGKFEQLFYTSGPQFAKFLK